MNTRSLNSIGSIYDTLFVARVSRDSDRRGELGSGTTNVNVYDASQARAVPVGRSESAALPTVHEEGRPEETK